MSLPTVCRKFATKHSVTSSLSGCSACSKPEFAQPIYDTFGKSTDPGGNYHHFETKGEQQALLNDIKANADFDWPGGKPEQFREWSDSFREFNSVGNNPHLYSPEDLDGVIDRFKNLEAPDGRHNNFDEFDNRPGGVTGPLKK